MKFAICFLLIAVCVSWNCVYSVAKKTPPPWAKWAVTTTEESSLSASSSVVEKTEETYAGKKPLPKKKPVSPWAKKGGPVASGKAKAKKPWLTKAETTPAPTTTTTEANPLLQGSSAENSIFITKLFQALTQEIQKEEAETSTFSPSSPSASTVSRVNISKASSILAPEDHGLFENLVLLGLLKPKIASKTTPAPVEEETTAAVNTAETTVSPAIETTPLDQDWADTQAILKLLAPQLISIAEKEPVVNNPLLTEPNAAEKLAITSLLTPEYQFPAEEENALAEAFQALLQPTTGAPPSDASTLSSGTMEQKPTPSPLTALLQLLLNGSESVLAPSSAPDGIVTEKPEDSTEAAPESAEIPLETLLSLLLNISNNSTPEDASSGGLTATPADPELNSLLSLLFNKTIAIEAAGASEASTDTPAAPSDNTLAILASLLVNSSQTSTGPNSTEETVIPDEFSALLSLLLAINETAPSASASEPTTTSSAGTEEISSEATTSEPSPLEILVSLLTATTPAPKDTATEATTVEPSLLEKLEALLTPTTLATEVETTTTEQSPLEKLLSILTGNAASAEIETTTTVAPEVTATEPLEVVSTVEPSPLEILVSLLTQTTVAPQVTTTEAPEADTTVEPSPIEKLVALLTATTANPTTTENEAEITTEASPLEKLISLLSPTTEVPTDTSTVSTTQEDVTTLEDTTTAGPSLLAKLLALLASPTEAPEPNETTAGPRTTPAPEGTSEETTTPEASPLEKLISLLSPVTTTETSTDDIQETTEAASTESGNAEETTPEPSPLEKLIAFLTPTTPAPVETTDASAELLALLKSLVPGTEAPDTEVTTATTPTDAVQSLLSILNITISKDPSAAPTASVPDVLTPESLLSPTTTQTPTEAEKLETFLAYLLTSEETKASGSKAKGKLISVNKSVTGVTSSPGTLTLNKNPLSSATEPSRAEPKESTTEANDVINKLISVLKANQVFTDGPTTTTDSPLEETTPIASKSCGIVIEENGPLLTLLLQNILCKNAKLAS